MKNDLLSKTAWIEMLRARISFLAYNDEHGNAKEILELATELYDCANEIRYQARQKNLLDVERYAIRAMNFSDAVLAV